MTRWLLIGLGVAATITGVIGIFLPVLPTTPFLLVATWAFARSSPRLHVWLRGHPRLGAYVRDWEDAGVVPVRAKLLSVVMMGASLFVVGYAGRAPTVGLGAMAVGMATVAAWLLSRPSRRPEAAAQGVANELPK